MKKNYLIEYSVIDINNKAVKKGKIKAKNKSNKIEAQVKLEAYLKKKYNKFNHLIVHSCREDNDFLNMFHNIIDGNNPFGF